MGIEYLTPDEIRQNQESIQKNIAHQPNYFVRSGDVRRLTSKYCSPEDKILEVGCGSGDMARTMIADGYTNISAVDIGNYLSDDLKDKIDLHEADICFEKFPVKDSSLDVIFAIAIIEHLENPLLIVREAARTLKKHGKFIIAIPHIHSLRSKWEFARRGDVKGFNEGNNHITLQTQAVFKKTYLKDFRLIETIYSAGYMKLFGRKLSFNKNSWWFNKYFADKVLYVLEKK